MNSSASSRIRGDIVEDIVALLYEDSAGLRVSKRIRLPVWYDADRTSEIDVLLEGNVAGISIKIAIECKNYSSPVGISEIRDFAAKLDDLRIPRAHSIFVPGYFRLQLRIGFDFLNWGDWIPSDSMRRFRKLHNPLSICFAE
jgi:hypothetical protein